MADRPLGWAIAGTGTIARRFAADMRFSTHGRVVVVASASVDRASRLAAAIGSDVTAGNLDTALRDPRVSAVYVAGRNEEHCRQALRCLAAGKAVLIEKPIATSVADAERIRAAARDAGRLAMEAMWMRFTPGMRHLKTLVDEGAIGTLRSVEASLSFRNLAPRASPLFDLGVYPVSLAIQLLGSPARVAGLGSGDGGAAGAILSYPGAVASLRCGFDAEGPNVLSVGGSDGVLATGAPFFCPSYLVLRRLASPFEEPQRRTDGSLPRSRLPWLGAAKNLIRPLRARRIPVLYRGTGLQYQADHFAECLAAGLVDSPVMPLAESLEAIRVVAAAEAAISRSGLVEDGQRLEA